MHYLITGGAGFIGSNLVRHLLQTEENIFITCIDNFDSFYSEEIKQLNISDFTGNSNFRLLKYDLSKTTSKELA